MDIRKSTIDNRQSAIRRRGSTTLEWVLLLAAFGFPMCAFLLYVALPQLADYYRMVVFLETLPFP
jgi:hypothetical protein